MVHGDDTVFLAIRDRVEAFAAARSLQLALPAEEYKGSSYPYLDLQIFPISSPPPVFGSDLQLLRGIIQITIVQKRGRGLGRVNRIVSHVRDAFSHGDRFPDDNHLVTLTGQPNPTSPLFDRHEVRVPVSIPYQALI